MTERTETQQKIVELTEAMRDLLLYKNEKYGDSALHPKRIFHKGNVVSSILIRLDDKLSRVMENNDQLPRASMMWQASSAIVPCCLSVWVWKKRIYKS